MVVVAAAGADVADASSISLVLKEENCSLLYMHKPHVAKSALTRTRIKENTASVARSLRSRTRTRTEKTAAAAAARISLLLARMKKLMWLLHNAVAEAALLQYECEPE